MSSSSDRPVGSSGRTGDTEAAAAESAAENNADLSKSQQSWRNLLALDAQIFQSNKVRMLTPEARLLINLKLNGPMKVTDAMELAGVSYRGFYAVLERLHQAGLIAKARDAADHRVRNLQLDPSTPIPAAEL